MNDTEKNQLIVNFWKDRIECLFYWQIQYIHDNINFCKTEYNKKFKIAKIYKCDVCEEDDYILHEIIKIAFIECDDSIDKKLGLISNLVALIKYR